jgi:hypothetical protein
LRIGAGGTVDDAGKRKEDFSSVLVERACPFVLGFGYKSTDEFSTVQIFYDAAGCNHGDLILF